MNSLFKRQIFLTLALMLQLGMLQAALTPTSTALVLQDTEDQHHEQFMQQLKNRRAQAQDFNQRLLTKGKHQQQAFLGRLTAISSALKQEQQQTLQALERTNGQLKAFLEQVKLKISDLQTSVKKYEKLGIVSAREVEDWDKQLAFLQQEEEYLQEAYINFLNSPLLESTPQLEALLKRKQTLTNGMLDLEEKIARATATPAASPTTSRQNGLVLIPSRTNSSSSLNSLRSHEIEDHLQSDDSIVFTEDSANNDLHRQDSIKDTIEDDTDAASDAEIGGSLSRTNSNLSRQSSTPSSILSLDIPRDYETDDPFADILMVTSSDDSGSDSKKSTPTSDDDDDTDTDVAPPVVATTQKQQPVPAKTIKANAAAQKLTKHLQYNQKWETLKESETTTGKKILETFISKNPNFSTTWNQAQWIKNEYEEDITKTVSFTTNEGSFELKIYLSPNISAAVNPGWTYTTEESNVIRGHHRLGTFVLTFPNKTTKETYLALLNPPQVTVPTVASKVPTPTPKGKGKGRSIRNFVPAAIAQHRRIHGNFEEVDNPDRPGVHAVANKLMEARATAPTREQSRRSTPIRSRNFFDSNTTLPLWTLQLPKGTAPATGYSILTDQTRPTAPQRKAQEEARRLKALENEQERTKAIAERARALIQQEKNEAFAQAKMDLLFALSKIKPELTDEVKIRRIEYYLHLKNKGVAEKTAFNAVTDPNYDDNASVL